MARTATPGLTGKDDAFAISSGYDSADWSSTLGYTEVGADFNPEVGFLALSNYRKVNGFLLRRIRPDNLWNLFEIRPHVANNGFWDFDGFQQSGFLHFDSQWEFRSGRIVQEGLNFTKEGVKPLFENVNGVVIQPGTYDHTEVSLGYTGDRSAPLNVSLRSTVGGRFGGDRFSLAPTVRYRIGEKFSSAPAYNYNEFDMPVAGGNFTVNLLRLRLSYSFTPKELLQILLQYNEQDDEVSTNLRFS